MISLDAARKLKEAGLVWEPQLGDWFYFQGDLLLWDHRYEKGHTWQHLRIFAPHLDQLLAEIERRGYWWEINHALVDDGVNKYKATISKKHDTSIPTKTFIIEILEDAATQALLWILQRGVE